MRQETGTNILENCLASGNRELVWEMFHLWSVNHVCVNHPSWFYCCFIGNGAHLRAHNDVQHVLYVLLLLIWRYDTFFIGVYLERQDVSWKSSVTLRQLPPEQNSWPNVGPNQGEEIRKGTGLKGTNKIHTTKVWQKELIIQITQPTQSLTQPLQVFSTSEQPENDESLFGFDCRDSVSHSCIAQCFGTAHRILKVL